ncbi:cell division protein FtsL, partial [Xanthobacter tagetidis]
MLRVANVVMVVALLVTAGVVYHLKYASTSEAERLASLRVQIRKEREVIGRLKAEWARRTSPIYIQGLVQRHLDLKRLDVDSISDLSDLPERPQGSDDKIGGMIEALTDAPLVTSSVNRSAPAVAGAAGSAAPGVPAASALRQPSAPKPPA